MVLHVTKNLVYVGCCLWQSPESPFDRLLGLAPFFLVQSLDKCIWLVELATFWLLRNMSWRKVFE